MLPQVDTKRTLEWWIRAPVHRDELLVTGTLRLLDVERQEVHKFSAGNHSVIGSALSFRICDCVECEDEWLGGDRLDGVGELREVQCGSV